MDQENQGSQAQSSSPIPTSAATKPRVSFLRRRPLVGLVVLVILVGSAGLVVWNLSGRPSWNVIIGGWTTTVTATAKPVVNMPTGQVPATTPQLTTTYRCGREQPFFQAVYRLRPDAADPILAGTVCHEAKPAYKIAFVGFGDKGFDSVESMHDLIAQARVAVKIPQNHLVAFVGLSDEIFAKMVNATEAEAKSNVTWGAWRKLDEPSRTAVRSLRNHGFKTPVLVEKVRATIAANKPKSANKT